MPIYKRGKEKYEVRLYGWEEPGKPKGWIVRGTRREAEKFEAQKRIELDARGPLQYRTAPRFSEFSLGRYKVYAEAHLKAKTWQNRQYQIATLIEHFGAKRLDRISAADVERFQAARTQEGIGPAKVNDDIKALKAILNYAREHGVTANVPKVRLLPERGSKKRVKVWTAEEVQKLYKALRKESPRLMGIVTVMLNTGLRKGEALALEWSSVDLDRRLLRISPSEEWQPKDNEPREVPIGKAALPWLSIPKKEREHKRWVFPNSKGRRYAAWPQRQFDRAREAAGIGGSPHVCRHTYASHFLASQPDLFLLAQVLGHSHTRVTELYSHLLPDHLERARDAVHLPAPLTLAVSGKETVSGHASDTVSGGRRRKPRQKGQSR